MSGTPIETERKFLIRRPALPSLAALPGARVIRIVQTYLTAPAGVTARVRRAEENGHVRWIYTEKRRLSAMSAYEDERELTPAEAAALLARADRTLRPIEKTRCAIPAGSLWAEVDLYPFWDDRAILEIELPREDAPLPPLPYLTIVREVTDDFRYKNRALAAAVPDDPLA